MNGDLKFSGKSDAHAWCKNPLLVAAGRMNGRLRRPWTDRDRQVQRENALRQEPWQFTTGPKTEEGRRQSAANGRKHRAKPGSRRSVRALLKQMRGNGRGKTECHTGSQSTIEKNAVIAFLANFEVAG